MPFDSQTILARIDAHLNDLAGEGGSDIDNVNAALQGALRLVGLVYGRDSAQEATLVSAVKAAQTAKDGTPEYNFRRHVRPAVIGTLKTMKGDVEAGLVGDLRRRAIGEVIADMLSLAKEALANSAPGARNVAAVLSAASYEDTIRKMGATFANIHDRRELSQILQELRAAGVLDGAPFTTAQSYLKFRNDSLHADWGKLDDAVVGSCIAFVEQLLLKHFS